MNKRIKELAEQAGGNPNYKAFRGYFLPPPPDYIDPATVDLEKFAELIVEECRYVMDCNKGSDQNPAWNQALSETSLKIKEHFGVEE